MAGQYCPKRGDVVWLTFSPQAGHEQAGPRPALVLSPEPYNRKVGLALLCPITSQVKGYPFEVALPPEAKVKGVVLSDRMKSLDWRERGTRFCCTVTPETVKAVMNRLGTLLDL